MECYELINRIKRIDEGITALCEYLEAIKPTVFDNADGLPMETIKYFIRNINKDIEASMLEAKAVRYAMRLMKSRTEDVLTDECTKSEEGTAFKVSDKEIIDFLLKYSKQLE